VEILEEHPDVALLLHPECGCVSACMAKAADGTLPQERIFFLSTEGMLRHIGDSRASEFAVETEVGIMHRLKNTFPTKEFYPVNPDAVCAFMKTITLDRVLRSLETMAPPSDCAGRNRAKGTACGRSHARAHLKLVAMLKIGILGGRRNQSCRSCRADERD
jgi:quinolinate synthase